MQTQVKRPKIDEAKLEAAIASLPDLGANGFTDFQQKMIIKYYASKGCRKISDILKLPYNHVRRFARKNNLVCIALK